MPAKAKPKWNERYKKYYYRPMQHGKRYGPYFGTNERECYDQFEDEKAEEARGKEKQKKERKYFGFWLDTYLSRTKSRARKKKRVKNPEEYAIYVKSLMNDFEVLRDTPIDEIMETDIYDLLESIALENPHTGKPTSNSTMTKKIYHLKGVFDLAKLNKAISANPMDDFEGPAGAAAEERAPITDDQVRMIMETPHRAQMMAMLMLFGFLRPGEAAGLTREDFDFENGTIQVNKVGVQFRGEHREREGSKTAAGTRTVIMADILRDYLERELPTRTEKYVVFDTPTPPSKYELDNWWDSYQIALRNKYAPEPRKLSHGVKIWDWDNFTRYQLRHNAITWLDASEVEMYTRKCMVGHATGDVTMGYTHRELKMHKENLQPFNDLLATKFGAF